MLKKCWRGKMFNYFSPWTLLVLYDAQRARERRKESGKTENKRKFERQRIKRERNTKKAGIKIPCLFLFFSQKAVCFVSKCGMMEWHSGISEKSLCSLTKKWISLSCCLWLVNSLSPLWFLWDFLLFGWLK